MEKTFDIEINENSEAIWRGNWYHNQSFVKEFKGRSPLNTLVSMTTQSAR